MTDTTTAKQLFFLTPGDTFTFSGSDYVLVQFNRTRAKIARLSDGKSFVLNMSATVVHTGHDDDALSKVLEVQAERQAARREAGFENRPTLRPGTKVRLVSTPQTRKAGIAGAETVIVKTNTKTYGLANGYNVTPGLIEEIK